MYLRVREASIVIAIEAIMQETRNPFLSLNLIHSSPRALAWHPKSLYRLFMKVQ